MTGSAIDLTAEVDALKLNAPSTLTGAVNYVEALNFSLIDQSSANAFTTATASLTADISPALPTITGGSTTSANQGSTTDTPFAGVTIGDTNPNDPTDTLRITLSDANASLVLGASQPAGVTFSNAGGGVYNLVGLAADVTSELDALTLNAPTTLTGAVNDTETLTFSLSDSSSTNSTANATASIAAKILGPNATKTFGYTGKIETLTIATSGYYNIEADGAQGGGAFTLGRGGLGAMASGDVYLSAGAQLEVVVGGKGGDSSFGAGGGGGGSFVIELNDGSGPVDINEVIAGGGGGEFGVSYGGGGQTSATGGNGQGSVQSGGVGGAGGTNGKAGQPGLSGYNGAFGAPSGGGGGGFTGGAAGEAGSVTGVTFAGGQGARTSGDGGFGGGGGGGPVLGGAGGGGGYGGGGGGGNSYGGGGGSFVNPDANNVVKTGGTHSGDGLVTIEFAAACYARGSRIAAARGEVEIENLRVGEKVLTASGRLREIVWIGHRRVDISRHPAPRDVWPVRVAAGAFGEGLPRRDLWLSPGHNIAAEGALMPISCLINGRSVAQIKQGTVEYWHVELDAHDVILAEGLPAESYLDCGNRAAFSNGAAFVEAHPDFEPKPWAATCLPLVKQGPAVARTKARLLARLGDDVCAEAGAHVVVDGARVEPIRLSETRLAFALPPGGRDIALRSNVFIPAYTVAESADTRRAWSLRRPFGDRWLGCRAR